MSVRIDVDVSESQLAAMTAIPAAWWFTQFVFRNGRTPIHPDPAIAENNEMKQALVADWLTGSVKGKRVLDLFSANGGFSIMAALAGATEVVGVEFSPERIRCAELVADALGSRSGCRITFKQGNVYDLSVSFDEPFDVVLCLGGLYHIADPAHVLRQIGGLTKERLIVQTSQVLPYPGNWARFKVRRHDRTTQGKTSIRGGYGTWHYTPACLRELLLHGGFRIIEERQPPMLKRRRFPWYLANCEPLAGGK